MIDFEQQISQLKKASPLEIPSIVMNMELHDKKTAIKLFNEISEKFAKEDLVDNVVEPAICTIVDAVLALPMFKGVTQKGGLSTQRIMQECRDFNYDEKVTFLMPDSNDESQNQLWYSELWAEEFRKKYERSKFENKSKMNKYKNARIKANGGRVNMEDEYRMTRDISGSRSKIDKRRNDPKFCYVSETDHIVPLHDIFLKLQGNSGLSDEDIRRIANQDYNFAVTGRVINNPKRDMSNKEFIAKQDELKACGLPYVVLSDEQRNNMIRMEIEAQKSVDKSTNKTILKNLSGRGANESKASKDIYSGLACQSSKLSLMYVMGNAVLLIVKPLFYEFKDGFTNGFISGVKAQSNSEAFKIRFGRVRDYVWNQLMDIASLISGDVIDFLKNFLSSLLEGIISMFVGIFKQILKVIKEGVKIIMQAWSILFGEKSKDASRAEKADAIVKLIGSSIVAFLGIGIDALLKNLPENIRGLISTLLSGIAGILVFYVMDKADLFNVNAERRNQRINEIFDLRIQEVKEKTQMMTETVCETLRHSYLKIIESLADFNHAIESEDYAKMSASLKRVYVEMNGVEMNPHSPEDKWNC